MSRTWIFQSRSNPDKDYLVQNGSAGLWCDCPGFQNHENCWHVQKAWGQMEYERMLAKKVEINQIKTGRSVFQQMAVDRVVIYRELERKKVFYGS